MVMLVGNPEIVRAYSNLKKVQPIDPYHVQVEEAPAICVDTNDGACLKLDEIAIQRLAKKGDELALRLVPTVNRLALERAGQLSLF